ncbi:MAG TPA: serine hydrolase domain-containing protein, partial [Holophaga sp.]|nr:serine hydrolase domain-containing protein [Holophaga sp.]
SRPPTASPTGPSPPVLRQTGSMPLRCRRTFAAIRIRLLLRRSTLVLAAGLLLSASAAADTPAARATPNIDATFVPLITAEIARHRSAYNDPGISIALMDDAGTSWSSSFGCADRESGRPVDAETIFEMGSISKLFTCAAVLQLREQGRVELDRPVRDYLPGFDAASGFASGAEAITVRMLMTHHSGLMMDDDPWETSVPERYFHRAVFEHIKDKPLLFPPGQRMHYSSFGVNLLGLLVERQSGMEFACYMKEKVLLPLDMTSATFDVHDLDPGHLAKAYQYHPVWDLIPMEEIRPAGSLRAPVQEVAHFATMLLAGGEYRGRRLLSRESVAEMMRIQNRENCLDGGARVALGFMAEPRFLKTGAESEVAILYHFGQARTKSLFLLVPAWKQGLVLSCNDYGVTDASYDLFSKVWNRYVRALFAEASQPYDFHLPVPDRMDPPAGFFGKIAGDYATTAGLRVLEASGDLRGRSGARLVLLADGRLTLEPWAFPRTLFRFDGDGAVATIDGYPIDRWERLGPPDLPAALTGCAGIYEPTANAKPRSGMERIVLHEAGGRLLVRPIRSVANAMRPAIVEDPATLFPLRFTPAGSAKVVNGALSGFLDCRFVFGAGAEGMKLLLIDRLGATEYCRRR